MGKKGEIDNDIICAYLWQDVIRLGFSPSSTRDKKIWLRLYGQSLKDFWEIESFPKHPSEENGALKSNIDSPMHIGLSVEYKIQNTKADVVLEHYPPANNKVLVWEHHIDEQYFSFPNQLLLTQYGKRFQAVGQMKDADIGNVIDSLIIHPAPHQHIKSPLDNNKDKEGKEEIHKIRIGGGVLNPFLYLFHLRIQLCPDQNRRKDERNRLIELFKEAIIKNVPIPIDKLMMIP